MKKYFSGFVIILLAASCSTGSNNAATADSSKAATPAVIASAPTVITADDIQKGSVLITKYDCSTCHTTDKKVIGPAFKDVAKKYAGIDTAVVYLANKVINGGGGVWGTVPMSKHINLSEPDAEEIIKYILSLKTK